MFLSVLITCQGPSPKIEPRSAHRVMRTVTMRYRVVLPLAFVAPGGKVTGRLDQPLARGGAIGAPASSSLPWALSRGPAYRGSAATSMLKKSSICQRKR